jgi:hypothetical protein
MHIIPILLDYMMALDNYHFLYVRHVKAKQNKKMKQIFMQIPLG